MTSTTHPISSPLKDGDLRGVARLAALGFGVFVAGAAALMVGAGLFSPVLLVLAALINVTLMLPICGVTAFALDFASSSSEGRPPRRIRIARRALQLASLYWTAAGLAFLLSPLLARL